MTPSPPQHFDKQINTVFRGDAELIEIFCSLFWRALNEQYDYKDISPRAVQQG
jgi:hypothetical protein